MKLTHRCTLIIITGGPGTGKSYAAELLHTQIENLEILSYDEIKEAAFDRFGFDNVAQKERLNRFSLEEFYLTLQKMMYLQKTILIEYPFCQKHQKRLNDLIKEYHYRAITILFYGNWETIYRRKQERDRNILSKRHPGHLTDTYHAEAEATLQSIVQNHSFTFESFLDEISKKNYDIQLGISIYVDVTDLSKISYETILRQIKIADQQ